MVYDLEEIGPEPAAKRSKGCREDGLHALPRAVTMGELPCSPVATQVEQPMPAFRSRLAPAHAAQCRGNALLVLTADCSWSIPQTGDSGSTSL